MVPVVYCCLVGRKVLTALFLTTLVNCSLLASQGAWVAFGLLLWLAVLVATWISRTDALFPAVFVMTAALTQNLLLGSFLNLITDVPPVALGIIELKTAILAVFGVVGLWQLLSRPRLAPTDSARLWIVSALFCLLVGVHAVFGSAPLLSRVAYGRNFTAFVFALAIGASARAQDRRSDTTTRFARFAAIAVIAFAVSSAVEWMIPDWWDGPLNLGQIAAIKGPFSRTTDFFGSVTRLQSLVGEPVNSAYILGWLTLLSIARGWWLFAFASAVQMFFTFGKGGLILTAVGVLLFIVTNGFKRDRTTVARALVVVGAALIGAVAYLGVSASGAAIVELPTLGPHFVGLLSGVANAAASPLGRGLGVGGNLSDVFALTGRETAVNAAAAGLSSESAVGVLATQLGVAGLILYAITQAELLRLLWSRLRLSSDPVARRDIGMSFASVLALLLTGLLQENQLGPQAGGFVYLWAGLIVGATTVTRPTPSSSSRDGVGE
jgi:hypothetical protein